MARLAKNRPQTMAEWLELLESIPSSIPPVSFSPPSSPPTPQPTPSVDPAPATTVPIQRKKRKKEGDVWWAEGWAVVGAYDSSK